MSDVRQELYLIADEMRGMASAGKRFAGNVYEAERADRMMALAAKVAALAEGVSADDVAQIFDAEPWLRFSPAIGVEAGVFDSTGAILLVQRRDNGHWALPGGVAEIGETLAEAALRELWEEAGQRGRAVRLLGVFDGRRWGTRAKVHLVHPVFLVECDDPRPMAGIEMLDARMFASERLPAPFHPGHEQRRIPKVIELVRSGETYFDPAASADMKHSLHQRPVK